MTRPVTSRQALNNNNINIPFEELEKRNSSDLMMQSGWALSISLLRLPLTLTRPLSTSTVSLHEIRGARRHKKVKSFSPVTLAVKRAGSRTLPEQEQVQMSAPLAKTEHPTSKFREQEVMVLQAVRGQTLGLTRLILERFHHY